MTRGGAVVVREVGRESVEACTEEHLVEMHHRHDFETWGSCQNSVVVVVVVVVYCFAPPI